MSILKRHFLFFSFIALFFSIASCAGCTTLDTNRQIQESIIHYEKAKTFEEVLDYEQALEHYLQVNPLDADNYSKAVIKAKELEETLYYIDNCAKAWAATYASCPSFDQRRIATIYYAHDDSAYAALHGKGTVTIISSFMGTKCTYIIAPHLDRTLSEVFPYYRNTTYNLCIHAIGTENHEKGGLKYAWDAITNTHITVAESECETMDISIVKKYMEEHYPIDP